MTVRAAHELAQHAGALGNGGGRGGGHQYRTRGSTSEVEHVDQEVDEHVERRR